MPSTLPIDSLLTEIAACVRDEGVLVLEAEPGAGKTTRVPLALLETGAAGGGTILVTEPRRLAARLAASHVARQAGSDVGSLIGYSVRFDHRASGNTRVLYATEGVVLRRFLSEPDISDVTTLVIDEFHERHVATDLLLCLALRLRRTTRPDLRIVVMSATMDAESIGRYLGNCRTLRSEGRLFPITIEHAPRDDDRPLERRVTSAVRDVLLSQPEGDMLVFLPGAAEIRRTSERLAGLAGEANLLVVPLHGDLSVNEQARAVEPADRRRVILSTNVAESSVTVAGVTAVIDSGLARIATHSPWNGLPALALHKVSKASAVQRAGRAGRLQPGRVLRLYTQADFESRPAQDTPEITRTDLAEPLLLLRGLGVTDPHSLTWPTAPSEAAISAAEAVLSQLNATDLGGGLSPIGRRMLDFPVPPRLARIVVAGENRGVGEPACRIVALLSERDIRQSARARFAASHDNASLPTGPSDALELLDRLQEADDAGSSNERLRRLGFDAQAVHTVRRTARRLSALCRNRIAEPEGSDAREALLLRAVLAGFADRVARRRQTGSRSLILYGGDVAELSEASVVRSAPVMVALDIEERRGHGRSTTVRLASAVDADWLLEDYGDQVDVTEELTWNNDRKQVERTSKMTFGSVVLDEERSRASPSLAVSELLLKHALAQGRHRTVAFETLARRIDLLREHLPDSAPSSSGEDLATKALERAIEDATGFDDIEANAPEALLLASLSPEQRRQLDVHTPERITLAGGRSVGVHYDANKDPWIESRLQDFFGTAEVPMICGGRLPLTIHLLAPNRRAVQVTRDLAGFWERHYPALRRELGRRYPKHPWPEDGRTASPPAPHGGPPRRRK